MPERTSAARWRAIAPWLALAALFVVPPLVSAAGASAWVPQGWLYATLAQAATMIVFALSYNLLLGETGLLSLGHAAPAGIGALVAARLFNLGGVPLPLLPLAGGIGGALVGALSALVLARRAGTAFAMITLGLGELVAAAAWTLPDWFGGEAGVAIDRASGPVWGALSFGPDRAAYALIVLWCLLACAAIFALTRSPFVRLANAVRDNPVRAAALGIANARVRAVMIVWAGFFAGIAGTLALINLELAASESVGMMRSGAVLIATVTGGAASFFGPVLGSLVWVLFSVVVAGVTRAWLLYVGLFFIVVVLVAPDGLAGWVHRQRTLARVHGWRRCLTMWLAGALAIVAGACALVGAVQWAYAARFGAGLGEAASGVVALPLATRIGLAFIIVALASIAWLTAARARHAARALREGGR